MGNNEIEQISRRISKRSSRCSLNGDGPVRNSSVTSRTSVVGRMESRTSVGRTSLPGGLKSKESRISLGSRFSNQSECQINASQSTTSFQSVIQMLHKHRQEVKTNKDRIRSDREP